MSGEKHRTICAECGAPLNWSTPESPRCDYCGTVDVARREPSRMDAVYAEIDARRADPVRASTVETPVFVDAAGIRRQLRCPCCRQPMTGTRVDNVELDECASCGGMWISNFSARALALSPRELFVTMARKAGQNAVTAPAANKVRKCAVCPRVLDVSVQRELNLDVCSEHGIWFDAFELATFVERIRAENPVAVQPIAKRPDVSKRPATRAFEVTTTGRASSASDESPPSSSSAVLAAEIAGDLIEAILDELL